MNKRRVVEPWLEEKSLMLYRTGDYSIVEIGQKLGYSAGTIYNVLKKAGCEFNRKWKHPASEDFRKKQSLIHKGKTISEEQRKAISERNSCNYNGLNGYGHTKAHNRGYVLTYVPKHPNAHKDGYVMLHTVLMERQIGRYLMPNEEVHHINHNRTDNRIENLQLMDKHEHRMMHMKERHEKRRNGISIAS